ncbi:MAG: flagellar protein FlaG [Deltaproteobacteria bacterium]|nr:flagellar protein FlaG [Deltaproteobacteria bacterium]
MVKKIFLGLDPKVEKMPVKIPMKKPSLKHVPLVNPDIDVKNNPKLKAHFAEYKTVQPQQIKADIKARIQSSVDTIQKHIETANINKGVNFTMHQESGKYSFTISDRKSGEVLKSYPSDKLLDLAGRIRQASGILVNKDG